MRTDIPINIINKLITTAKKSNILHRHAAVLLKNGTPVCIGSNIIRGNTTVHAEINVINHYLANCGVRRCFKERKCLQQRYNN